MISARDEDIYVDSLYSNYHVQFSSEELLLPLLTPPPDLYPTVLNKPSGLVTHMESKSPEKTETEQPTNIPNVQPVNYPFHPSNFLSVAFNKRAPLVQETPKKLRPSASVPRVLSSIAPPGANLYEATYAGVEVYELIVGNNSVMRRRDDTMVNATHLLKVAGIEKGRRTKILEKEVLNTKHEKIQGGYGKYQGTWVTLEQARELAHQFNVYEYCRAILDFP
ncbi:transcriptional regulator swi6 [Boothiomyces sp. JEL0838]|nr:transcriptional regulator swi6 [Boothiomyces sp. JEL0838]